LYRSNKPHRDRGDAGFTLIETLVALAVVAISLAAIGALVGANIRATRILDQRLALLESARAILTGLPDRKQLASGQLAGEFGDRRWRVDVQPFVASFIDPNRPSPWVPEAVILRVQAPSGEILRLDTVRLVRGGESAR